MSDAGWVSMHRGWSDNPIFSQKEFCQRMAWYWLIENACWKPTKTRINGKIIELQRGQLSYSFRFLAKAWGWELRRVTRFINGLKSATMVTTESATGKMIITICNYSKYQDHKEKTPQETPQETPHERNSSATNKNKETSFNQLASKKANGKVFSEEEVRKATRTDPAWMPNHIEGEVLPAGWQQLAEDRGIKEKQIYASWRKFKETVSASVIDLTRWQAWVAKEKLE